MTDQPTKKPRGFQTLTPEQRREIASMGGRKAHASGNAHQYSSEEARAAAAKRVDRQRSAASADSKDAKS
jgi:hypothetical protein